jgi:hypothetical protein
MTSQLVKDLYMLQWTLNSFLEAGSDQVRRSDIDMWVDPGADAVFDALRDWESKQFIAIEKDPRQAKEKDVCVRILKRIEAIPEPDDLNAENS